MSTEVDPAALSVDELRALVHTLRQQLTERDGEIARLRGALPAERDSTSPDASQTATSIEPTPGSQEDLLTQLEQLYPDKT